MIFILTSNKINYSGRKNLANNIVYYRLKNGWSQEALAERLSIGVRYLQDIENARRNVKIDSIEIIANSLKVEPFQLLEKRDKIKDNRIQRKR